MASSTISPERLSGGSFLISDSSPRDVFTPEDLTPDHVAIARTTEAFWNNEVAPHLHAIQHQAPGVAVSALKRSAELGLLGVMVPEKFGGMELDLISTMVVAEGLAKDGSYAAWHGAHAGIGTLPLLLFGTEEQKSKYLPLLASAKWIGAYCLSEPQAGSDALAAKTRADLSSDGTHYVLNGQKMWITNGGAADLYTVFAKVNGEQFTAFLVERSWPGVRPGAEEKKLGIKGSSTTPVYFDSVRVPGENVLGEIGRGHVIAFNILNVGRLKLGAFAVGAARHVLSIAARYAMQRKAFGKPIAEFGLIQQKLADMAIRLYATESITYRVAGMIESQLQGFTWDRPDAAKTMLRAFEEFAAECSFVKVYASEALDFVVDEAVQIHGGYGYHEDYAVETAYRDSRINRIFEGTNEINRLLSAGMLLKRAQRGQLGLVDAVKKLQSELLSGSRAESGTRGPEAEIVGNAKKIFLLALGIAYGRYLNKLEHQQEVLAALADIAMQALVMESALLRAVKGQDAGTKEICAVLLQDGLNTIQEHARSILAACAEGDTLRTQLAMLKKFTKFEPVNSIGLRRAVASRVMERAR